MASNHEHRKSDLTEAEKQSINDELIAELLRQDEEQREKYKLSRKQAQELKDKEFALQLEKQTQAHKGEKINDQRILVDAQKKLASEADRKRQVEQDALVAEKQQKAEKNEDSNRKHQIELDAIMAQQHQAIERKNQIEGDARMAEKIAEKITEFDQDQERKDREYAKLLDEILRDQESRRVREQQRQTRNDFAIARALGNELENNIRARLAQVKKDRAEALRNQVESRQSGELWARPIAILEKKQQELEEKIEKITKENEKRDRKAGRWICCEVTLFLAVFLAIIGMSIAGYQVHKAFQKEIQRLDGAIKGWEKGIQEKYNLVDETLQDLYEKHALSKKEVEEHYQQLLALKNQVSSNQPLINKLDALDKKHFFDKAGNRAGGGCFVANTTIQINQHGDVLPMGKLLGQVWNPLRGEIVNMTQGIIGNETGFIIGVTPHSGETLRVTTGHPMIHTDRLYFVLPDKLKPGDWAWNRTGEKQQIAMVEKVAVKDEVVYNFVAGMTWRGVDGVLCSDDVVVANGQWVGGLSVQQAMARGERVKLCNSNKRT